MNITKFITSNEKLKQMHFATVYQTILVLISMGVISIEDFGKFR